MHPAAMALLLAARAHIGSLCGGHVCGGHGQSFVTAIRQYPGQQQVDRSVLVKVPGKHFPKLYIASGAEGRLATTMARRWRVRRAAQVRAALQGLGRGAHGAWDHGGGKSHILCNTPVTAAYTFLHLLHLHCRCGPIVPHLHLRCGSEAHTFFHLPP